MSRVFRSLGELSALQIGSIFDMLATEFGTLWWVREDIWRQSYADYKSDRPCHPGVSVRPSIARVDFSFVPMLHGRSEKSAVAICGFNRYDAQRPTYFGHILRPAKITTSEFTAHTNNPNLVLWESCVGIVVNHHKPKATSGEERALRNWWNDIRKRRKQQKS